MTLYDSIAPITGSASNISFTGCSTTLPHRANVYYTIVNLIDTTTAYYRLVSLNNILCNALPQNLRNF
jgi:hypothetical protein